MIERALLVRFYFETNEATEAESLLEELGELTLQPVLKLLTCPNVPSEAWLEGHQRPPPAGQPLRQAAAQLVLRYQVTASGASPWIPP